MVMRLNETILIKRKSQITPVQDTTIKTVEGFEHRDLEIMSVQYHPEAHPGPLDTEKIFFDRVVETGKEDEGNGVKEPSLLIFFRLLYINLVEIVKHTTIKEKNRKIDIMPQVMNLKEIRRKVKETSEKELIRESL